MDLLEAAPVDSKNDKPAEDLTILDTVVVTNPYREAIAELLLKEWKANKLKGDEKTLTKWTSMSSNKPSSIGPNTNGDSIGKYVMQNSVKKDVQ